MLRFRPKLGSERNSEWRCCFCLHVRTGTILLGTWHLMLHLVALGFLAAVVRDPRLLDELENDTNPMPTPLSSVDTRPGTYMQSKDHNHSVIYLCTLAITLMLIYGASRGKPAHLLPFFCLQIFDFAITVLTATGYLYYLRSIRHLVAETKRVPWREQLLALPAPALAMVVLSVFLLAVLLKGYCISMVWRCYKYLTMRAHALHSLTPFVISGETLAAPPYTAPVPQPDYSSLLPDYEEAVKQTPPPSYRAATLMAHADPALTTPDTPPGCVPSVPTLTAPAPPAAPAAPAAPPAPADTVVMLPQQGTQARV